MRLPIISSTLARRLAVTRQHLAGPQLLPNTEGILAIVRDLGCIQLDPTSVVAPSHLLVFWSRLGPFDTLHLNTLLWKERRLFEDFAHCTSIVPTEDYPIFSALKRGFATGNQPWARRVRLWMKRNKKLRSYILAELRQKGALPSSYFEDKAVEKWQSTGWTAGRNVGQMLTFLWAQGKIMIAGRSGKEKLWNLTDRFLPEGASQESLTDHEVTRRASLKSLHALGVARAVDVKHHYIRRCYSNLADVLKNLESENLIMRLQIREDASNKEWPGTWYIHADDLSLLHGLKCGKWEPRTTLLSPFDNLICDRARTQVLFNFKYSFEMYVPKFKRKYGCYVMPILHGDRLIGRVDPVMDRKRGRLTINAVYAEPNAPMTFEGGRSVAKAIEELGAFLEVKEITYTQHIPKAWKTSLR